MSPGTEENNEKILSGQYQLGWESNAGLKNTKQKQYTITTVLLNRRQQMTDLTRWKCWKVSWWRLAEVNFWRPMT